MLVRIIMLPVVAGVSYEVLKLLAKSENVIVRALRAPGLALQRLTTKEPSMDMLEVAIASFKGVLVMEGLLPEGEDMPKSQSEQDASDAGPVCGGQCPETQPEIAHAENEERLSGHEYQTEAAEEKA